MQADAAASSPDKLLEKGVAWPGVEHNFLKCLNY